MSQKNVALQTWRLEPRDPLVIGDGTQNPALVPRHTFWLPPPGTLAGFVRANFVADRDHVPRALARGLLDIQIRGPWLADWTHDQPSLWWPVPADVAVFGPKHAPEPVRGRLIAPREGEGVSWPEGRPQERETLRKLKLVYLSARIDGAKTRPPRFGFWPWREVVAWSLGGSLPSTARDLETRVDDELPIIREYRVHVGRQRRPVGTAEPEALFSSAGLRFAGEFGLAAEVADARPEDEPPGPRPGLPPRVGVLGAESRISRSTVLEGACFPPFDSDIAECYRQRIDELKASGASLGLRLQLLTPAFFGDWRPRWHPGLPEALRRANLQAVSLSRHVAISGWNLQHAGPRSGDTSKDRGPSAGGPRAVRRLVPEGTVYFFGEFEADTLFDLCRSLWGRSLCTGRSDDTDKTFLAPPAHDGYGLVLPAPCSLSVEDS